MSENEPNNKLLGFVQHASVTELVAKICKLEAENARLHECLLNSKQDNNSKQLQIELARFRRAARKMVKACEECMEIQEPIPSIAAYTALLAALESEVKR